MGYKNGCSSGQIGSLTDDCGQGPEHELVCCGSYRGGWRKPNKNHGEVRACCSEAQGAGKGLRWFGNMSENEKNTLIITTRFVIKNLHHQSFPQLVECNLLFHPNQNLNHYVVQPTMLSGKYRP